MCFCLLRQKTGNAIRALGRLTILSANSRRCPTATTESLPTSEPLSNPIESLGTNDTKSSHDDQKKSHIESVISRNERSSTESSSRGRNMYSFRYKTEVNIFPEETLDSSLQRGAHAPSDLDAAASLKNERPTSDARSCSRESESAGTRETDTAEKTEGQSDVYTGQLIPTRQVEEGIEIITRCHVEECIVIQEDKSIIKSINVEKRSLSNNFEDTVESQQSNESRFSSFHDETSSKSTTEGGTSVSELRETHSTSNIEETRIDDEEAITEARGTEPTEKSDQKPRTNSQKPRRVCIDDSRDSGISDCASNLSSSSQHANELDTSSIIEEEVDSDNNGNLRNVSKEMDQFERRRTLEMIPDLEENARDSANIATLSAVTKASREINRHEGVFHVQFV